MAEDQRYTHPLVGVILCCTSIHPEIRSELASKATSMGALHRHDLTSDVTHLIVGDLNTPKYKYVAKHRPDVKVVDTKWVDAMHEKWIAGEDVDVTEYEKKHKYPTFCGLRVSVTNISDVDERAKIQQILTSQSAAYHPDLTRVVTHLIAAEPTGNKYEFAKQWNIKVVSPEWFYDSLERGMALDEMYYDPLMTQEARGVGAKPASVRTTNFNDIPGGDREGENNKNVAGGQLPVARRQIRKKITDKIGSQSQNLWDDIIGAAGSMKVKKRDEWDDGNGTEKNGSTNLAAELEKPQSSVDDKSSEAKGINDKREKDEQGMFGSMLFCVYGFDDEKASVLNAVISAHSGSLISPQELQTEVVVDPKPDRCFIIVPNIFPRSSYPETTSLLRAGVSTTIVSFWWIEACLHKKEYFYPEPPTPAGDKKDILCFPFESMPLLGFDGIELTLTGFSGVEFMHVSKIIELMGANYDGNLNAQTTTAVIANVSADVPMRTVKSDAAAQWGIPVVSVNWLWLCLFEGRKLEFQGYINRRSRKRSLGLEGDPPRKMARAINDGAEVSGNESFADSANDCHGNAEILKGCVVSISKVLKDRAQELANAMTALGATVVHKFSHHETELLTHFIFPKEVGGTTDDYKIASKIPGCYIVSPEWLHECLLLKRKAAEKKFLSRIKAADASPLRGEDGSFTKNSGCKVQDITRHRGPFFQDDEDDSMEISTSKTFVPLSESSELQPPLLCKSSSNKNKNCEDPELCDDTASNFDVSDKIPVESDARTNAVKEFLKMGQEELSFAFDRRKKPRTKLKGRAFSNMSAMETSLSLTGSVASATDEAGEKGSFVEMKESISLMDEKTDTLDGEGGMQFTQFPPVSQAIGYADPEAQREKRKMIAKLSGEVVETPKPTKARVVQDSGVSRRSTRKSH